MKNTILENVHSRLGMPTLKTRGIKKTVTWQVKGKVMVRKQLYKTAKRPDAKIEKTLVMTRF